MRLKHGLNSSSLKPFNFTNGGTVKSSGMSFLGTVKSRIDRRSPYEYLLTKGEIMRLVRCHEDPHAIRVINALRVEVGDIKWSVSRVLAPLIDSCTVSVACVVNVTTRKTGELTTVIPCLLYVFTKPKDFNLVESCIMEAKLDFVRLDDSCIFGTLSSEEAVDPPKEFVTTDLLFHQKQGLAWLLRREGSHDLPPFWELENDKYIFAFTGHSSEGRPDPIRGGFFADDVGLGKTLTFLSLIAFDKFDPLDVRSNEVIDSSTISRKKRKVKSTESSQVRHSKTTLIVSPFPHSKWVSQITKHTRNLSMFEFCGGMTCNVSELERHDIVLTSYDTLLSKFSRRGDSSLSPLYEIEWRRIILDEAHVVNSQHIPNLQTLKSQRRWASLGISAKNGSLDLFSLVAFLKIPPFSVQWFWDICVLRPFATGCEVDLPRLQELLKHISLRRTKENDVIGLPTKSVETCFVDLSAKENSLYDQTESKARVSVRNNISSDKAKDECKEDLEILNNLISVLHGEDFQYPLDISPQTSVGMTSSLDNFNRSACPLGRYSVAGGTSSKVDALLNLLSSSRDENPATISVVFSQFRRLLISLQKPLEAAGYKTLCLDGVKNAEMTNQVIKEFIVTGPNEPTVILASFKVVGSGINLTAAARVYMMDPCLNPTVEEHVVDSIYRISQKQDVTVVRIIARQTIEEKLLALLEEKRKLLKGTFLRRVQTNDGKLLEIGLDDLRGLLSL